jgi:F0F1-type ATP synthase assembly protein I
MSSSEAAGPRPPGGLPPEDAGGGPSGDARKPLADQAPQNQWLAFLNLGWVFVATMVLTVFGGLWLDKRFGTAPLFILLGVCLGFAANGYSFYVALRKLNGAPPPKHQD